MYSLVKEQFENDKDNFRRQRRDLTRFRGRGIITIISAVSTDFAILFRSSRTQPTATKPPLRSCRPAETEDKIKRPFPSNLSIRRAALATIRSFETLQNNERLGSYHTRHGSSTAANPSRWYVNQTSWIIAFFTRLSSLNVPRINFTQRNRQRRQRSCILE